MIGKAAAVCLLLALGTACAGIARHASDSSVLGPGDVVARHVAALGGRERLEAIHSLQIIGILNERGTLHPMFIDRQRPNLLRVRMIHDGRLVFSEVYTGSASWEGPPGHEDCAPARAAASATRRAAEQFDDPVILAAKAGLAMRLVPSEAPSNRPLYRLDVNEADGAVGSYDLDAETFLLLRARHRRALHPGEPERVIEVAYDDYRPVAGVLYPFRILERDRATREPLTVMRIDWLEANVAFADSTFDLPARCR